MAKTEAKTKPTEANVNDFLLKVEPEQKSKDCMAIVALMQSVTKMEPKMWGPSIVGFGQYHYRYESGHEGDSCLIGFSPRKANIALYVAAMIKENEGLLSKLGKYKNAKSCLYINKLSDVDINVLKEIVSNGFKYMKNEHDS